MIYIYTGCTLYIYTLGEQNILWPLHQSEILVLDSQMGQYRGFPVVVALFG